MSHDIIPDILPDITPDIGSEMISYLVQDGLVPPLDKEASGIITVSEEIIKAYASKHSLNARAINDLIKDVLKNPAFNADEVDTNMLKRLQASIDSGDIQIIFNGRPKARCYPFDIEGHCFRNKNPRVPFI